MGSLCLCSYKGTSPWDRHHDLHTEKLISMKSCSAIFAIEIVELCKVMFHMYHFMMCYGRGERHREEFRLGS